MQNIERKNKAEGGGQTAQKGIAMKFEIVETAAKRPDVKRVLKCGELRAVMCAETRNKCFGRTVWEDLESGDLAVIINIPGGEILVDLYTFLKSHKFFNMLSDACAIKKKMFVYGTDDLVIARRIDDTAYGRGVWKSDDGTRYVVVMTAGGQYFMALADFVVNRQKIERIERYCF